MKRNPPDLEAHPFDVVVVGAGITGACLAFDAAIRGMAVALIDKGDFGAATSAASSKLLHGGVRYLQQFSFGKVRESAVERIYFQNLAPHLISHVPFIVPTYRGFWRGRFLLSGGFLVYGILAMGQGRRPRDPERALPPGRSLSAGEVRDLVPGFSADGLTGGRFYYESHMHSSERMTLALVDGSVRAGGTAANYMEARKLLVRQGRVESVLCVDLTSGREYLVRGKVFVNAAGPWIRTINEQLGGGALTKIVTGFSKGVHIVTRQLTGDFAVALPTHRRNQSVLNRGGRHVFIIPWRGRSLIGTTYTAFDGDIDAVKPTKEDIHALILEINSSFGPGTLGPGDVLDCFAGLYPLVEEDIDPDVYQGTGDYQIVDHSLRDGVRGLFSVLGAKFTTARAVAERAVDQIAESLGGGFRPCLTRDVPTPSGDLKSLTAFRSQCLAEYRGLLSTETIHHLIRNYGTKIHEIAEMVQQSPGLALQIAPCRSSIAAEAVFAVRREMALHLEDLVFRRTGLGTVGHPGREAFDRAATLMGIELDWDEMSRIEEVQMATSRYVL